MEAILIQTKRRSFTYNLLPGFLGTWWLGPVTTGSLGCQNRLIAERWNRDAQVLADSLQPWSFCLVIKTVGTTRATMSKTMKVSDHGGEELTDQTMCKAELNEEGWCLVVWFCGERRRVANVDNRLDCAFHSEDVTSGSTLCYGYFSLAVYMVFLEIWTGHYH